MPRSKAFSFWSVFVWLAMWSLAAVFVLPVAAAVAAGWFLYQLYRLIHELPPVRRARDSRKAQKLYRQALAIERAKRPPSAAEFARHVGQVTAQRTSNLVVRKSGEALAEKLFTDEGLSLARPGPRGSTATLDAARYRDGVLSYVRKVSDEDTIELARETIVRAVVGLSKVLSPALREAPVPSPETPASDQADGQFNVRLLDVLPDVPRVVEDLCAVFQSERVVREGLFETLRQQLGHNLVEMSGTHRAMTTTANLKLVAPTEHKGSNDEIVHGYLKHTPLEPLFQINVPFDIPQSVRFEHHWIVAGSGHGKSQTLQHLICNDLPRVAAGGASIVVIDSQGDMIRNIAGLKIFAEGQPLHGKLCLIDPTDIEFPVALNLFDAGIERMGSYSELDRERLMNGILELYDFVLGSLLSAELTQKQGVIFRYITRLMLHIPGATIHTFRELMEPKGYEKYLPHISKLEGTARAFFETEFNSPQFADTKRQVVRRLWEILENRTFERMFSHPKNKLNLFAEMNAGKVILINCAKELLKQNGTEIFGRFFIALVAQAAQERTTLPQERRMPTFIYLDEAADYLDQNVSIILEQARKVKCGLVLCHQHVGQLSPKLQDSVAANTSIKFAGGVSDKDARAFSHMLRCEAEFIEQQPKGHFAAFVRNMTASAVSLKIPLGHLERMPRMTKAEAANVLNAMRTKYAVPWKEIQDRQADCELDLPQDRVNPDTVDTEPASSW